LRNNLSLKGMDFGQLYAIAEQLVEEGKGLHHDSDELFAISEDLHEILMAYDDEMNKLPTAMWLMGIHRFAVLIKLSQTYNY
jgi:hypothetical protein